MTSPYEHIPQRVGHEERDAAVQRLRTNLDEGRLDRTAFDERVAVALAATTQDDLDPLFQDLPPVASSGTFELYPHQTVAPVPTPYVNDPAPYQTASRSFAPEGPSFGGIPRWLIAVVIVTVVIAGVSFVSQGFWFGWMFFILPGIFGRWGQNRNYRRRDGRR